MTPYYEDSGITLYCGDCREVLPALASTPADLVLTDPPYPREFDSCWDSLATAAVAMKDDSFLVTFLGHYQLPRVMSALSTTLRYYWCAILPNNNQPIMHGFKVKCCWKPCLVYAKGRPSPSRIWYDNFSLRTMTRSWKASQALHKWGQAEALQYEPIDAFCPPDGLILDPFCGAGTNLIAARDFGRRAIGIEIDERCCEIAANRLGQGILFSGGVA
jgi:DNA modification methylase